jgi:hypothetical protein
VVRRKVTATIAADDFKIGTQILVTSTGTDVLVTILRDAEPCKDQFGRDMRKFWARREDTKQEGFMIFGPNGTARAAP